MNDASEPLEPSRYYVNHFATHPGAVDLTIDFGYEVQGEARLAWVVGLTMAWEEALAFHRVLGNTLAGYQRAAGEIRDIEKADARLREANQNGGGGQPSNGQDDSDPPSDPE